MTRSKHKKDKKSCNEGVDKKSLKEEKPFTDRVRERLQPKPRASGVPSLECFKNRLKDKVEDALFPEKSGPVHFKSSGDAVIEFGKDIIVAKLLFEKKLEVGEPLDVAGSEIIIRKMSREKMVFDVISDMFHSENNESSHDAIIDMGCHVITFSPHDGNSVIARVFVEARHVSIPEDANIDEIPKC